MGTKLGEIRDIRPDGEELRKLRAGGELALSRCKTKGQRKKSGTFRNIHLSVSGVKVRAPAARGTMAIPPAPRRPKALRSHEKGLRTTG